MKLRSPLIFLTGVLMGGISTYIIVGTPEVQVVQSEISGPAIIEQKIPSEVPVPSTAEIIDVPKYPELESAAYPDITPADEIAMEEDVIDEPEVISTQAEKFERSIASEEQAQVVSDDQMNVEEPKIEEAEPDDFPDERIN